jgi:predicted metallopeptidase
VIEYQRAEDVKQSADRIVRVLEQNHIDTSRIAFIRSKGSKSPSTVARIHGLGRIWRQVLQTEITYIIEVLSEKYDNISPDDKERTLIHELLHIPEAFGGGFRSHRRYVNRRRVETLHQTYRHSQSTTANATTDPGFS